MMKLALTSAVAVLLVAASSERTAEARDRLYLSLPHGKALYTTCAGCHGNEGEGRPEMRAPRLAGQNPNYLIAELELFRAGFRGRPNDPLGYEMSQRANALVDDREVKQVISWIAQLPHATPKAPTNRSSAGFARGKTVYAQSCAACHGANALGSPDVKAPALKRLDQMYIAAQLRKFRSGARGWDFQDAGGSMMAPAAKGLDGDHGVDDVSEYLSRFP